MTWWWSWLLTGVGATGLLVAGSRNKYGWAIGLAAQGLWMTYAISTQQWGFILGCFVYGSVYARNFLKWRGARQ